MIYPDRFGRNGVGVRPASFNRKGSGDLSVSSHPWQDHSFFKHDIRYEEIQGLKVYGIQPTLFGSYNSEIPLGSNDGGLWQGRGYNSSLTAGGGVRYKGFTLQVKPQFVSSQNQAYELSEFKTFGDLSEYAMHLTYADIPMRFGDASFSRVFLGDSYLEFASRGWKTGISSERYWTGPAVYNPLLFSNSAPGFLNFFAATNEPLETEIGDFDGRIFWGSLRESDYFDEDTSNDRRFISGLFLSYRPVWVPGLELGFNRVAYSAYSEIGLDEMILPFKRAPVEYNDGSGDDYMSMMSLFANWNFDTVNSEVYFEWGRNDNRRVFMDILAEPELNRGYVVGAMKRFDLKRNQRMVFTLEATNLENVNVSSYFRDFNIWYTSEAVPQGFTHEGQVLGAGIGPGSSIQKIDLSYYASWGMVGASISRISHNTDRHFKNEDYFRSFARFPEFYFLLDRHEIETRPEAQLLLFLPYGVELQLNYARGNTHNRYNIRRNDLVNHHVSVKLRYRISGFIR
jgi:hypothetical protein